MKKAVIISKIKVSFQIIIKPDPFSIILLTITMNHLAGMIAEKPCNIFGILSIGKIKPESSIVGSIKPSKEMNIAICCDFATVEMNTPIESDKVI